MLPETITRCRSDAADGNRRHPCGMYPIPRAVAEVREAVTIPMGVNMCEMTPRRHRR